MMSSQILHVQMVNGWLPFPHHKNSMKSLLYVQLQALEVWYIVICYSIHLSTSNTSLYSLLVGWKHRILQLVMEWWFNMEFNHWFFFLWSKMSSSTNMCQQRSISAITMWFHNLCLSNLYRCDIFRFNTNHICIPHLKLCTYFHVIQIYLHCVHDIISTKNEILIPNRYSTNIPIQPHLLAILYNVCPHFFDYDI